MRAQTLIPAAVLSALLLFALSAGALESLLHIQSNTADLAGHFLPPSSEHFFGTDELGRDIFIRLLYGGRVSLGVGFTAAMAAAAIGTAIGLLAGYNGGKADALLMRLTDMLIALPLLPLLIILSAIDLSKLGIAMSADTSVYKIIILVALTGWTTTARLVRARTLTLKQMDFVRAATALGVKPLRIAVRHIFPNLLNTVIVAATLSIGHIILLESVLSFLGLGIQPPLPSWGNMLTNAEDNIWEHAALTIYPGAMIFITVLAFNFLGDGLQRALDPKSRNLHQPQPPAPQPQEPQPPDSSSSSSSIA
jgi:peptide/nickel transport system permease protein